MNLKNLRYSDKAIEIAKKQKAHLVRLEIDGKYALSNRGGAAISGAVANPKLVKRLMKIFRELAAEA